MTTTAYQPFEESVLQAVKQLLGPHLASLYWHDYEFERVPLGDQSRLQVWCQEAEDSPRKALVLRLVFLHEAAQLQLHNILMPESMRWQRLGKRTIKAIFDVTEPASYHLLLMDTVPSFHSRLLDRNAREVNHETILITSETDLEGDVGSPRMGSSDDEVRDLSIFSVLNEPPKPD